jgi:hypothetical protein
MQSLYELDHVFVCAASGAPEAEQLCAFGLTEGTPNHHPGQGTANRRFFFHNAMLELCWVDDPAAAGSALVRPTGLLQRWQERHAAASPFGICLRPRDNPDLPPPFPAWDYRPPYVPVSLCFYLGTNSAQATEPLLCYFPFGRRPDAREQPLAHAAGLRAVTDLRVSAPRPPSAEMRAVQETGAVAFVHAAEPLMEIGFDGERSSQSKDFRPHLPLKLCW